STGPAVRWTSSFRAKQTGCQISAGEVIYLALFTIIVPRGTRNRGGFFGFCPVFSQKFNQNYNPGPKFYWKRHTKFRAASGPRLRQSPSLVELLQRIHGRRMFLHRRDTLGRRL